MPKTNPVNTPNTSISADVAKLVSASTIAAIIAVAVTPLITRLFSAETFGKAAIFVSISTIIGMVACLRYELAILLPKKNAEAASILRLCLLVSLFIAALTGLGLLAYQFAPRTSSMPMYYWLLPVSVILHGFNAALTCWNARKRNFGLNSISRISEVSTTSALQVGSGLASITNSSALIGGYLSGRFAALLFLLRGNTREIMQQSVVYKTTLIKLLMRYKKFPLVDSFSAFTNTASTHLPPLMLGLFFSPASAGFYALGYRLIQLPMATIGSAIAQVFFQRFAESQAPDQRSRLTLEIFERLVIIELLPMALLGLLGEEAFQIVFGAEWAEAGIYAQILSLWGFFWLISSPLSNVFIVLERQEIAFKINMLIFGSRFLSLLFGVYFKDPRLAITLFSLSGAVAFLYLLIRVFSLTGIAPIGAFKIITAKCLHIVPIVLIIATCQVSGIAKIHLLTVACFALVTYFATQYKKLIKLTDLTSNPTN